MHTSLVYIVAAINLTPYAATDIGEMIEGYDGMENVKGNNLLVYMDDKTSCGLTLWSHADGWLPGIGSENMISSKSFGEDSDNYSSSGARMDILDLKTALERCPPLEYLVFDACDMHSIEVAYELHHLTEYLIASPVEVSAYGAPYEDLVPALF